MSTPHYINMPWIVLQIILRRIKQGKNYWKSGSQVIFFTLLRKLPGSWYFYLPILQINVLYLLHACGMPDSQVLYPHFVYVTLEKTSLWLQVKKKKHYVQPRFIILGDPGVTRSVGLGKMVVNVFKNRRESYWEATLNKPVPQLIWMLIWVWLGTKNIFGGQHLSCCFCDLLIQKSLPTNWTFRRTCLSILKTLPLFTPTWPTAPGSPKMKFHLHEVEIMNGCQRKCSKWLIDC